MISTTSSELPISSDTEIASSTERSRFNQFGTRYSATVMLAARRRWMASFWRSDVVPLRSVRIPSSKGSLHCTIAAPASVKRDPPLSRSSSWSPRVFSSDLRRVLAAGWLMLCSIAARRIHPRGATLCKRSSETTSGRGCGKGIGKPYRMIFRINLPFRVPATHALPNEVVARNPPPHAAQRCQMDGAAHRRIETPRDRCRGAGWTSRDRSRTLSPYRRGPHHRGTRGHHRLDGAPASQFGQARPPICQQVSAAGIGRAARCNPFARRGRAYRSTVAPGPRRQLGGGARVVTADRARALGGARPQAPDRRRYRDLRRVRDRCHRGGHRRIRGRRLLRNLDDLHLQHHRRPLLSSSRTRVRSLSPRVRPLVGNRDQRPLLGGRGLEHLRTRRDRLCSRRQAHSNARDHPNLYCDWRVACSPDRVNSRNGVRATSTHAPSSGASDVHHLVPRRGGC